MNSHELCPSCREAGRCLFEEKANTIAKDVPPLKEQTPVAPNEKPTNEALIAHDKISEERIEARKNGCPNLNNINPYYPGKEYL